MRTLILSGLALSVATSCAYRSAEYVDGEGSQVCITTDQLANRIKNDWAGRVEYQEEEFLPEEKAWVNVIFHHAIGEDCDRIESAECTLGFNGTEVTVSATAEWSYAKNRELCDGPIEPLVASCQTVSLEEDTWTFRYSDMDLVVDVPSTVETPCMDLDPATGCSTAPGVAGGWAALLALAAARRRRC